MSGTNSAGEQLTLGFSVVSNVIYPTYGDATDRRSL